MILFQNYAPQTKILEGLTKDEMRLFEALFKGVSTRFGRLTIESPFENQAVIFCSFFQNLRLGSIKIRQDEWRRIDSNLHARR
jgi:hypothetical protein